MMDSRFSSLSCARSLLQLSNKTTYNLMILNALRRQETSLMNFLQGTSLMENWRLAHEAGYI